METAHMVNGHMCSIIKVGDFFFGNFFETSVNCSHLYIVEGINL